MKKLLPFLSAAILFAACNTSPKAPSEPRVLSAEQSAASPYTDTTGLAQFQAWKIQNELGDDQEYNQPEQPVMVAPEKVKKIRKVYAPAVADPAPAPTTPQPVSVPEPSAPESTSGSTASTGSTGDAAGTGSGQTAQAEEKKGWSKSTKGAVIGGVVGAGAGAVINKKNPVVGAVIGGVIGAGGGYVIGRKMDKKDSQ